MDFEMDLDLYIVHSYPIFLGMNIHHSQLFCQQQGTFLDSKMIHFAVPVRGYVRISSDALEASYIATKEETGATKNCAFFFMFGWHFFGCNVFFSLEYSWNQAFYAI